MPGQADYASPQDEIDLRDLWRIVWSGKWKIIALTSLFAIASLAYAFLATEWYRAEVLLAPAEQKSTPTIGGQLGGLAALAGVSIGGGDSAAAVATLRSRELAREFITDNDLVPVFFSDRWDPAANVWKVSEAGKTPDIRDAIRFFQEDVLQVSEDRKSGLTTVAIEWTDPEIAAAWTMDYVARANEKLRQRALQEAEGNVEYLQRELTRTNVLTLQQAIGRLLETELQKLMLARGNSEFAFTVVDAATPPKYHDRPRRAIIAIVATLAGGLLGLLWVFAVNAIRSDEPSQ
jgi:uncharacterized protein involved in exopolysaccharide biosynthesis